MRFLQLTIQLVYMPCSFLGPYGLISYFPSPHGPFDFKILKNTYLITYKCIQLIEEYQDINQCVQYVPAQSSLKDIKQHESTQNKIWVKPGIQGIVRTLLALLLTFTTSNALRESLAIKPSGAVGTIFSPTNATKETSNA